MSKLAQITIGGKLYLEIDADPTSAGLTAPIGSLAVWNNAGVGKLYLKSGSANTAWSETGGVVDLTPFLRADGTVAIAGSQLPDTDLSYDLGSFALRFARLYGNNYKAYGGYQLRDATDSFTIIELGTGKALPDGTSSSSSIRSSATTGSMAIFTIDQTANSVPVNIETGKSTTAGNSGDIKLFTGSVVSGIRGSVVVDALNLNMSSSKIINLADPTAQQDAATKAYVDAVALGLSPKKAVRVASTANVVIASALINGSVVDGITLATGDRVLLMNQTTPAENGIYVVVASGAAPRATDMDAITPIDEFNGAWVPVQVGTANAGKIYVQYGVVATVGTSAVNFQFYNPLAALVGGDMITNSGSTFSVDLSTAAGLESTNPGNVAGQLQVKLNGATLDRSASGMKVADGGISDLQINAAAAIAFTKMIALTPSTLPVFDASGKIISSTVTSVEAGYLSGVTSSIQVQLAARLPLAGGTMSGAINMGGFKISSLLDPTAAQDAATKAYVDSITTNGFWKNSSSAASLNANAAASYFGSFSGDFDINFYRNNVQKMKLSSTGVDIYGDLTFKVVSPTIDFGAFSATIKTTADMLIQANSRLFLQSSAQQFTRVGANSVLQERMSTILYNPTSLVGNFDISRLAAFKTDILVEFKFFIRDTVNFSNSAVFVMSGHVYTSASGVISLGIVQNDMSAVVGLSGLVANLTLDNTNNKYVLALSGYATAGTYEVRAMLKETGDY